jgi:hypothetical protein
MTDDCKLSFGFAAATIAAEKKKKPFRGTLEGVDAR